jgi:hypothetical protein
MSSWRRRAEGCFQFPKIIILIITRDNIEGEMANLTRPWGERASEKKLGKTGGVFILSRVRKLRRWAKNIRMGTWVWGNERRAGVGRGRGPL